MSTTWASVKKLNFDVICRPAGGQKVIMAFCSDGIGHAFGWPVGADPNEEPACGAKVVVTRVCEDDDEVCDSCFAAGNCWAQGGDLRVRS